MSGKSPIEWTEHTWNPIVGCSLKTPGCTNCYAMKMAARIEAMGSGIHYAGTTKKVNGQAVWTGVLRQASEHILIEPLHRKKPTTYFVNSMGDLFHEDCPDEWIDRVFAVMALCPQHTFQVLTKRAERMRDYCARTFDDDDKTYTAQFRVWCQLPKFHAATLGCKPPQWPLPNVWLGVSCERQQEADERIPVLLTTAAAIRFISAEPLLGAIDLSRVWAAEVRGNITLINGLDWVIIGGESGPNARWMDLAWARALRDQCAAAQVPFFFKQWGEWIPGDGDTPYGQQYYKVGKKRAGRILDEREHSEFPVARASAGAA